MCPKAFAGLPPFFYYVQIPAALLPGGSIQPPIFPAHSQAQAFDSGDDYLCSLLDDAIFGHSMPQFALQKTVPAGFSAILATAV